MLWLLWGSAWAGTITDATGAVVTASSGGQVVTLGGALTETVFALGAGGQVVATDITSTHPAADLQKLPKVGYYRNLSTEGLLSLKPELILCTDQAGPPAVLDQLRAAGVAVAVLPSDTTVEGAKARIQSIGTLLDAPEAASQLITQLDTSLVALSKETSAKTSSPRVLFIYVTGNGAIQVSGKDTAADAMIRLAGGVNAVDGWTGYRPITAEGVIAARPDVILVTERGLASMGGDKGLWAQPGLQATPAGKRQWRLAYDDLFLLGFGPRTGEAARSLARALEAGP